MQVAWGGAEVYPSSFPRANRTGLSVAVPALPAQAQGCSWPVLVWEGKAGSRACTAGPAQGGTTEAEAPLCEGIVGTVVPREADGRGW